MYICVHFHHNIASGNNKHVLPIHCGYGTHLSNTRMIIKYIDVNT